MLNSSLYLQEDLEQDNGHFSVLVLRQSGILSVKIVHKVRRTKWLNWWWSHSEKADTQSSKPRVHCPEVSWKSKGRGKLSIHCCADLQTIETVFRTINSVNQLSLHGAVAEMCEEESFHDRTGKPVACRDANHEQSMLNEVDIDFRIPALPHSVVKQAEGSRVRETF